MKDKKITLATVKKFIRENSESLFINVKRKFDGMIDGERLIEDGFIPANKETEPQLLNNTLGVAGAWFVGESRDGFRYYEDDNFRGIYVYNCCGAFILATKKEQLKKVA